MENNHSLPEQPIPLYTGNFNGPEHAYRIGKINAAGGVEYELKAKLNGNKTRMQICRKNSQGDFEDPIAEYDIQADFVGIKFEEDSAGYYWLQLQSGRQPAATKTHELTRDQGLKFAKIGNKLHFIGADDVRPYSQSGYGILEKSASIAAEPVFVLEVPVAPGKVAEIKYINATKIAFNREP